MNTDCLKLTTYSGERRRTERGLVADEVLDLYGRHRIELSVLLRGIEGFGVRHHLRSDRLLTLSEDLPIVSIAVDSRPRIAEIVGEVLQIERRGLVTLERARIATGETGDVPAEHDHTKLTVYVGRQERAAGTSTFVATCELLRARGIDGATVLLGVDGTVRGTRERARFLGRNANVPLMIVAVGSSVHVASVLPELASLLSAPLFTVERITVCKRDGRLLEPPRMVEVEPLEPGLATWQKLMIYTSGQAKHGGSPLHVALVRALRASGARGATCLRGIWGFRGNERPQGDRLLQTRRRVPVVTVVIDEPARIAAAFEIVDAMTCESGLVTSELVPVALSPDRRDQARAGR